jgi:hypothetical protein
MGEPAATTVDACLMPLTASSSEPERCVASEAGVSAAECGDGLVEVPVAMLECFARMWDEIKEHRQQEKKSAELSAELSIASTRLPSASPSTTSLASLLDSPGSLAATKAELFEELRHLLRESLSQPRQFAVCPAQVCVPIAPACVPAAPAPIRVERRFVSRPVTVARVRRSFVI